MKNFLFFLLLLLAIAPAACAEEEPFAVIEPHGHSAMINEVLFTPDGKTLISVGDDKTIRLWDTASGELQQTIRGQSSEGDEGKLYAAALSPNGKTLAVGGYTRNDEIRLIDLQSSEQVGLLKGHSNIINALAFSPDGRWLASGSADNTVRIWDVGAQQEKAVLEGHTDAVHDVAFSPDGKKLVSASYDKTLRLWLLDGSGKATSHKEMQHHSDKVHCVAFAPNGQYIVSGGFDDKILLWDGEGRFIKEIDRRSGIVSSISFSADSNKIVASIGESQDIMIVYAIPSSKKLSTFSKHNNTVVASAFYGNDLIATAGGDDNAIYLWAADSGAVKTHILGQGRSVWAAAFGKELNVAFGNSYVRVDDSNCGPLERSFNVTAMSLTAQQPKEEEYRRTVTKQQGLSLETTSEYALKITGGGTITNDSRSDGKIRSYSFTPSGDVVIGSDFSLKLYKSDGSFIREFTGHTGVVWAVSLDQSGRILASASDDQTIKLWNLKTGELLASLFVARDNEWICWTPKGYYAASAGGEKYLGWQRNRGMDKTAEYHPAYVFRKRFLRPEVVSRTIELASFEQAFAEIGTSNRIAELQTAAPVLPPEVSWLLPERCNSVVSTDSVLLKAKVASSAKITDLKVLVNGVTAATFSQMKITPGAGFDVLLEYTLPLAVQDNELVIYAANNAASASSKSCTVRSDSLEWQKPNLYMVSIGIKDYQHDKPLAYAALDAAEISTLFKAQKGGLFKNVAINDLHNTKATRGAILDALEWLRTNVTQKDVAVVFTAAHGYKENESYYLLPVEGDPKRLRQTAVSWHDYKDILGNLPCKVLLFLDTCYSGQLAENMFSTRGSSPIDNTEAIRELTSAGTGVIIMAASTGTELAHEHADWGHGAFTKALLEGLDQGKADHSGDHIVQLQELDHYVAERVKDLTKGEQHPKMNFSPGINLFPIYQLP